MDTNARPENPSNGYAIVPMAAAAALDASAFSKVNATDTIPPTWEERARKAWEYYIEEPLVKNCVNSWRTFAVGDEIKITSGDEALKDDAAKAACRLDVSEFIKDMILQLLVKGDAVGFKRYAASGQDIEEVVCVNPVSVKVKYAQGSLIEAKQYAEDSGSASDPIDLPVDQVIHIKWDAPGFSPRGNSLVLPAFQAIELLRDYRRAEQAIAKRWATPFRLLKVGGSFGQKMVMPDQRMLEQVRDMVNKMDMKSGLVVPFYVNVETHGTDGQVLNVEDITKLPDYDPMGAYQAGFLDRGLKGGYRNQYRFDITEKDLEEKMKDYSLVHTLTNREGMSDFIETVLENNGAMVSTVEKMRIGIPPSGMSPVSDMQTGGGSYFFTRIKKKPTHDAPPALYFKKSMLRRMDAISYSHDAYGKVVGDYVQKNRGNNINDWKSFSGVGNNETIFKYSVTLLDNIEYIVANSAAERQKIIKSFTSRGIKKLPDGRKVEDIVHTPNTWKQRK